MDNEDRVEGIVVGDDLHDTLQAMNAEYGRGEVVSITYSTLPLPHNAVCGMAVCQLTRSMCARPFYVEIYDGRFIVTFLGHCKSVVSDYYDNP